MKIDPGYYKVRRGKHLNTSYHFLKVWVEGKQKFIQIDHGLPQQLSGDEENYFVRDYEIIKRYSAHHPIRVESPRIIFEFKESGCTHQMVARNWAVVRRILDQFPRLWKAIKMRE
jgi:hypothetical protein